MKIIYFSILSLAFLQVPLWAQSNAFSFQGRLIDGGTLASGPYDIVFRLFDAETNGTEIAPAETRDDVAVASGGFAVKLNFGDVFAGSAPRFLQIEVRPGASGGAYTVLSPRQEITNAPRANNAASADALSSACNLCVTNAQIASIDGAKVVGPVPSALTAAAVTGVVPIANGGTGSTTKSFVDLTTDQTIAGNKTFTGTIAGNGSGLINLNGANIAPGTLTTTQISPENFSGSTQLKLLGGLRWDVLKGPATFPVGSQAQGIASDGANIWVTNPADDTVTKLRARDGALLGTFPVGDAPIGLAFDGAHIWVANNGGNNVSKLRASDGAVVGTFTVGASPYALAFDGFNIWVINRLSNTVSKLRASDGANLGNFPTDFRPTGIAFTGDGIAIANFDGNTVGFLRLDGTYRATIQVAPNPTSVAFDGTSVWVISSGAQALYKFPRQGGTPEFTVGPVGSRAIAFDGANIWIADTVFNQVFVKRISDGAIIETFPTGVQPFGLAFDGSNMWSVNLGGNSVTRLPPLFPVP